MLSVEIYAVYFNESLRWWMMMVIRVQSETRPRFGFSAQR